MNLTSWFWNLDPTRALWHTYYGQLISISSMCVSSCHHHAHMRLHSFKDFPNKEIVQLSYYITCTIEYLVSVHHPNMTDLD